MENFSESFWFFEPDEGRRRGRTFLGKARSPGQGHDPGKNLTFQNQKTVPKRGVRAILRIMGKVGSREVPGANEYFKITQATWGRRVRRHRAGRERKFGNCAVWRSAPWGGRRGLDGETLRVGRRG